MASVSAKSQCSRNRRISNLAAKLPRSPLPCMSLVNGEAGEELLWQVPSLREKKKWKIAAPYTRVLYLQRGAQKVRELARRQARHRQVPPVEIIHPDASWKGEKMEAARTALARWLLGRPRAGRGRLLLEELGTHPSASATFPAPTCEPGNAWAADPPGSCPRLRSHPGPRF